MWRVSRRRGVGWTPGALWEAGVDVESEPAQGSWLDTWGLGGSEKESKRGWKVDWGKIGYMRMG